MISRKKEISSKSRFREEKKKLQRREKRAVSRKFSIFGAKVNKNHYSKDFVSDNFLSHDLNDNSINPDVSALAIIIIIIPSSSFDIIVIEFEISDQKHMTQVLTFNEVI